MRFFAAPLIAGFVLLGAACASAPRAGAADLLRNTTYAPDAEVSLDAMTQHERGFYYRDIMAGTGDAAAAGRWVHVSYLVRLADGTVVDRSTPEAPLRFRVGDRSMIPAFDLAVRDMRVGGTRQLVVPPRLGYGAAGSGRVPANAVLVMVLRLERVE